MGNVRFCCGNKRPQSCSGLNMYFLLAQSVVGWAALQGSSLPFNGTCKPRNFSSIDGTWKRACWEFKELKASTQDARLTVTFNWPKQVTWPITYFLQLRKRGSPLCPELEETCTSVNRSQCLHPHVGTT